jgi:protein-L-isoaspartate(D-aspartate) O-methyltransferase
MKPGIKRMIADIESEVAFTRHFIGKSELAPEVMDAMRNTSREEFVPAELQPYAYDNGALPIGQGQTISQPYIVALMTDLLQPHQDDKVLEVGTGSGYQTAILSQLVNMVYTIEVIKELGEAAAERLQRLHYTNIKTRIGNGYHGWPEYAPYDSIIVTAAASHIPQALIEQLKPGGRLVIPIGLPYMRQELMLIEKDYENNTHVKDILGVAFVPLQEEDTQGTGDEATS